MIQRAGASWHYMNVGAPGPLLIVRIPIPRRPRWRHILRALTPVMHSHKLRQQDISYIEGLPDMADRLAEIYSGVAGLPEFWLYEWRDDAFALVREGRS